MITQKKSLLLWYSLWWSLNTSLFSTFSTSTGYAQADTRASSMQHETQNFGKASTAPAWTMAILYSDNTLPCCRVTTALQIPVRNKHLRVPGRRAQHGLAQEQLVLGSEAQSFQHWQLNRNQNLTFNWCQLLMPNSCWVSSSKKGGPCLSGTSYSQLRWVTGGLLCSQQYIIFPPFHLFQILEMWESQNLLITKTRPCLPVT